MEYSHNMNKRHTLVLFLFAAICSISALAPHKFYVSKSTIEYNARTGVYEVTCKLFTDDLERAIDPTGDKPAKLGTDKEAGDADSRIEKYIAEHFVIAMDDQPTAMRFVGKESENDLTFCYLEIFYRHDFRNIKVHNTIFFELFPEQQNIVDLAANGKTQTAVLLMNAADHVFFP